MAKAICNKCKKEVDYFDEYDNVDKLCFKCYRLEWGTPSPQESDANCEGGEN